MENEGEGDRAAAVPGRVSCDLKCAQATSLCYMGWSMAKKRKLNRREFGKLAGGAVAGGVALLGTAAGVSALEGEAAARVATAQAAATQPSTQQAREAAGEGSGLNLSPEMEERVRQARERTARQLRGLREKPIAYDAEPAFAFRAKAGKKNR